MSGQLTKVTENLREMIMRGQLTQGERIKEVSLAQDLGVSRTPVRLALAILEKENLVEGIPNKGFTVRSFTLEFAKEVITIRATLEGMAARLAAEQGLAQQYRKILEDCIRRHETEVIFETMTTERLNIFSEINERFHETVLEASGSTLLKNILDQMAPLPVRTAPLLMDLGAQHAADEMKFSLRDHKSILDAIISGAGTRAEFIMREHGLIPLKQTRLLIKLFKESVP